MKAEKNMEGICRAADTDSDTDTAADTQCKERCICTCIDAFERQ